MARGKTQYVCQSCGAISYKWSGKCEHCNEWNTLTQEALSAPLGANAKKTPTKKSAITPIEHLPLGQQTKDPMRHKTTIDEFDYICGGGLVEGSAILLGGEPGIGKSTLLMQIAAALGGRDKIVLYISGEESARQLQMRAKRLDLSQSNVALAVATNVSDVLASIKKATPPDLIILDSIQTAWLPQIDSAPGTISQVRACASELIRFAKKTKTILILVGHVTKEGQIAGPRVLEHMVDVVIYFEGDKAHHFRLLRAVKNRYGATDEVGVFEMRATGLHEVKNPSALFLDTREDQAQGISVFAGIEGTRPLLMEIQTLAVRSRLTLARRAVLGWDANRLAMLLAILEAKCKVICGKYDIFLNIAGGLRIKEPAADLAVAAAMMSALSGKPLPKQTVFFGELSLSGSLRPVAHTRLRLKEAKKLGFKRVFLPDGGETNKPLEGIEQIAISNISMLKEKLSGFVDGKMDGKK